MLSFIFQCFKDNNCKECLMQETKTTQHLESPKQTTPTLHNSNMRSELTLCTSQDLHKVNKDLKLTIKPFVPEQLYSSMFSQVQVFQMSSTHNSEHNLDWKCKSENKMKRKYIKSGSCADIREVRKDLLNQCF